MFKTRIRCSRESRLWKKINRLEQKRNRRRKISKENFHSFIFSGDCHVETLVLPFSLSTSDFLLTHSHVYYYEEKNVFTKKNERERTIRQLRDSM
jgi:hypothetical protein